MTHILFGSYFNIKREIGWWFFKKICRQFSNKFKQLLSGGSRGNNSNAPNTMAFLPNIVEQTLRDIPNFPHHYFNLECKTTRNFRDHNRDIAQEFSYTAVLKNSQPFTYLQNIIPLLFNLFESLLQEIREVYRDFDLVRIFITHKSLTSCNIIIPPKYLKDISPETIMQEIGRIIRSNTSIPADEQLEINVAAIRNVRGMSFFHISNVWKDLLKKKCIIGIKNNDSLCLPRAIAVAIAYEKHKKQPKDRELERSYNAIRRPDRGTGGVGKKMNLQKRMALRYLALARLPVREGIMDDIQHYERALNVGITLYSCTLGNKEIYQGLKNKEHSISIYYTDNIDGKGNGHFSVITKVNALLSRSYYCPSCDVGYNNKDRHQCASLCNLCEEKCEKIEVVPCSQCYAPCRSQKCLERHLAKKQCESMQFCQHCHIRLRGFGKPFRDPDLHICSECFCPNCNFYYLEDDTLHRCYMKGTPSALKDDVRYIFYDFESMQEGESEHIPNLVVTHSICNDCQDVTQVKPNVSKCYRCGSRCEKCDKLNDSKTGFLRDPCDNCAKRENVFSGVNTVEKFCQWLIHPQHSNTLVIAHNAKAYDAYFIYSYLVRTSYTPSIIFQGSKIMFCQVPRLNIKLLDSVNFLPMPLAALPKSFGLNEMKKGYFPHFYNTFEQKEPNLPHLPDRKFYDPDHMRASQRDEFNVWYDAHRDEPFNMYDELLEYCRSDVNILLNACWKFRQLVLDITENEVDTFQYVTIASVCMGIFRTRFLPQEYSILLSKDKQDRCNHGHYCTCTHTRARRITANSPLEFQTADGGTWKEMTDPKDMDNCQFASSPVALLPPHGYARRDRFSKQCLQWLSIFQQNFPEPITIQTALSEEGEKRVFFQYKEQHRRFSLDGYFVDSQGQPHALEFNGCYFHGCPLCFPNDRETTSVGNKSISRRYQDTIFKENMLKTLGFTLHTTWSCEFEKQLKEDLSLSEAFEGLNIREPLDIRDCYFGGRTNALVLSKTFQEGEKAGYVDFCSLYPFALKHFDYPLGHPKRITSDFLPLVRETCQEKPCKSFGKACPGEHISLPYVGVIRMKILPPNDLYHPILPIRCGGKLMFPLCFTCAFKENITDDCRCKDSQRCLENTWCTPEVNAALTIGYKIVEISEILHWEEQSSTIFDGYINSFLRFKAQASGYPEAVKTSQERERFLQDYYEKEGIQLDAEKIEKNPGLRSIAKLALNSFYGKFGQNQNMKKCNFIKKAEDLYKMLGDVTKKLSDFHILNPRMMLIEYKQADEFVKVDPKTNVIMAAFCTSYARLHLWKLMNSLGKRVLYHDTDSVIYTYTSEEGHPQKGDFLGDLTDELACKNVGCSGCEEGHWIDDFVSCGPKNYAYHLNTGQTFCKVRGFSLNYASSQIVHFQSMREALYSWYNKEGRGGGGGGGGKTSNDNEDLITTTTQILRDKLKPRIYSKKVPKKYGVVYNKRRVFDNFTTCPFGYKC